MRRLRWSTRASRRSPRQSNDSASIHPPRRCSMAPAAAVRGSRVHGAPWPTCMWRCGEWWRSCWRALPTAAHPSRKPKPCRHCQQERRGRPAIWPTRWRCNSPNYSEVLRRAHSSVVPFVDVIFFMNSVSGGVSHVAVTVVPSCSSAPFAQRAAHHNRWFCVMKGAILASSRWLALLLGASLWMPVAANAASLNQLACAAGVHCTAGVTPTDAQIVLNLTETQAQTAFIDASQDWPDTAWRCAAGGRTCGSLSQLDAQTLIGLSEEAYGPAEQLRERGPSGEAPPKTTPKKPPAAKPPSAPGIVVETLPPAGPGTYREVPVAGGTESGDIQPLDGNWLATTGTPSGVGCMAGIIESLVGKMPRPAAGNLVFERPFQARQLIKSPSVAWRRLGPNHHAATLMPSRQAMVMSWDLRINSPSQMAGQSVLTVRIPGQPVCTITTPFTFQRQAS